jgi:hypothetical protein
MESPLDSPGPGLKETNNSALTQDDATFNTPSTNEAPNFLLSAIGAPLGAKVSPLPAAAKKKSDPFATKRAKTKSSKFRGSSRVPKDPTISPQRHLSSNKSFEKGVVTQPGLVWDDVGTLKKEFNRFGDLRQEHMEDDCYFRKRAVETTDGECRLKHDQQTSLDITDMIREDEKILQRLEGISVLDLPGKERGTQEEGQVTLALTEVEEIMRGKDGLPVRNRDGKIKKVKKHRIYIYHYCQNKRLQVLEEGHFFCGCRNHRSNNYVSERSQASNFVIIHLEDQVWLSHCGSDGIYRRGTSTINGSSPSLLTSLTLSPSPLSLPIPPSPLPTLHHLSSLQVLNVTADELSSTTVHAKEGVKSRLAQKFDCVKGGKICCAAPCLLCKTAKCTGSISYTLMATEEPEIWKEAVKFRDVEEKDSMKLTTNFHRHRVSA